MAASTDSAGQNLRITIHDGVGEKITEVNFQTLPEKCVWSGSRKIYCALPREILPEQIWPDAYLRGETSTIDRIVVFEVEKREIREVFNQENFDMANPLVTRDESHLFFVNRRDGTLWGLQLK